MQGELFLSNPPRFELRWDGSFLGEFHKNTIDEKVSAKMQHKDTKIDYYNLNLGGFVIPCSLKRMKSGNSETQALAIIDELKPLFGLRKMGSHIIKVGSRLHIIYNIAWSIGTSMNEPVMDAHFSSVDTKSIHCSKEGRNGSRYEGSPEHKKAFLSEMRRILIFREVLGLKTNSNHILIREGLPIDGKDSCLEDVENPVCKTLWKDWFKETSKEDVLRDMINFQDVPDLKRCIEDVVKRLILFPSDGSISSISPIIIKRITSLFPTFQDSKHFWNSKRDQELKPEDLADLIFCLDE